MHIRSYVTALAPSFFTVIKIEFGQTDQFDIYYVCKIHFYRKII